MPRSHCLFDGHQSPATRRFHFGTPGFGTMPRIIRRSPLAEHRYFKLSLSHAKNTTGAFDGFSYVLMYSYAEIWRTQHRIVNISWLGVVSREAQKRCRLLVMRPASLSFLRLQQEGSGPQSPAFARMRPRSSQTGGVTSADRNRRQTFHEVAGG